MFQSTKDGNFRCKDYCYIRHGTGGGHILDVVARGAELKTLEIRRGFGEGAHTAVNPTSRL
jgi:hypothetical protein